MYGVIRELSANREAGTEDWWKDKCKVKTKDRMWTTLPLCLFLISKFALLFQAATKDGGRAGPGARWPRPSPGSPGGHCGQAGASG